MTPTDTALAWRERLAAMGQHWAPCPGITAERWPAMRERALAFLEQHGPRAVELGWTVTDLFGVHPTLGTRRVDHAGALVIGGDRPISELTTDHLRCGHLTYYRIAPGRPVGVPAWEFKE